LRVIHPAIMARITIHQSTVDQRWLAILKTPISIYRFIVKSVHYKTNGEKSQ